MVDNPLHHSQIALTDVNRHLSGALTLKAPLQTQELLRFPSWLHIRVRCFCLEFLLGLLKNNNNEQLWHVLGNIT